MGYDVSIKIDTGGECLTTVEDVGNYTSNVSGMWNRAIPWQEGMLGKYDGDELISATIKMDGISGLSGMKCSDAIPLLENGIRYMKDNVYELKKLEPTNRWGTYSGALIFLKSILMACEKHPKAILTANW